MLQKLIGDITQSLDNYELSRAVEPFVGFIEQLTNWYIRRSRSRFWTEEATQDRTEAFETLYTVLLTLTKVSASFVPFISDAVYLQLKLKSSPRIRSHLCDFPLCDEKRRDAALEKEMGYAQEVVSLGHGLRKEHKIKVRQPLAKAYIISSNAEVLKSLEAKQHLIADELNVKHVEFKSDETAFVSIVAKPNFRVLGKKVGKLMNAAQSAIQGLSRSQLEPLLKGGTAEITLENETVVLTSEDVGVERKVKEGLVAATAGEITIALETELNEDLLLEGLARELVNKVNTMRRDGGFSVTDRIVIEMKTTERVKTAFKLHADYIQHEVLATHVHFDCAVGTEWDLNGEMATVAISLAVTKG